MQEYETIFAGAEGSRQLLLFRLLLRHSFPELTAALSDVVQEAKDGVRLNLTALQHRQTDPQRGYYHKWKNAFASFCGMYPDECHEYLLCEAYGSETIHTKLGLIRRPLNRSSTADRIQYSVLIDTLIRVAADHEFVVPPPIKDTGDYEDESED
jgi:hypothetical protein